VNKTSDNIKMHGTAVKIRLKVIYTFLFSWCW